MNLVFRYSAGHRHGSCKTSEPAAAQKHVGLCPLWDKLPSFKKKPKKKNTQERNSPLPYNMKLLFVQGPLHQNSANNQEKARGKTRNSSGIFNQPLI